MAKRKPEVRKMEEVQFYNSFAIVLDSNILAYLEHYREEDALACAKALGATIEQVPAKVFDHRVDVNDGFIQKPELPAAIWEVVEVLEFRVSAKGEPYYCRYHGFALTGTSELLYYVKPPRFNQTEHVYSKPASYQVEDVADD